MKWSANNLVLGNGIGAYFAKHNNEIINDLCNIAFKVKYIREGEVEFEIYALSFCTCFYTLEWGRGMHIWLYLYGGMRCNHSYVPNFAVKIKIMYE